MNTKNYSIKYLNKYSQTLSIEERIEFADKCRYDDRIGVKKLCDSLLRNINKIKEEEARLEKMLEYERVVRSMGYSIIAGIDEVGRGPLAGPVVAACVILPDNLSIKGINDSKKLSRVKREELDSFIREHALSIGIGRVSPERIDEVNIYEATKIAMKKAIEDAHAEIDYLLIDAMRLDIGIPQKAIIKGDALSQSIAAASIVAKVFRDCEMLNWHNKYPEYNFDSNMGYGTKSHIDAIREHGITDIHRKSFVKNILGDR